MPVLHWRVTRSSGVKEFDSAISTSYNELVLIQLRPGGVIDCILSVESESACQPFPGFAPRDCCTVKSGKKERRVNLLTERDNTSTCKAKDIKTTISYETEIGSCSYSDLIHVV